VTVEIDEIAMLIELQEQLRLIPLGEVGYTDQTTLKLVKSIYVDHIFIQTIVCS
jgi:hypothetical protein